jgi:hypothetical protein
MVMVAYGFRLPYFRRTWLFQLGWRPPGAVACVIA